MRTKGTAQELERRRRLAVQRVHEGYGPADVARFLGVQLRSVRRWLAAFRDNGTHGLAARPNLGRPPKLTFDQELDVLAWFYARPTSFGFATDLWTAPRVAQLIHQKFGVSFHPRYVNAWLAERGITPQKPACQPRERSPEEIERWLAQEWERIKKKPRTKTPTWC